jgi:predicted aspartyl protease
MTALAPSPIAALPFDLVNDLVLVQATVAGTPATLILDTGTSACALDAEWAAQLSLEPFAQAAKVAGTGDVAVSLATVGSIVIGGVELERVMVALISLEPVSEHEGRPIHGVIGHELFRRFVVSIDYARREVTLFAPEDYAFDGRGSVIPLTLDRGVPLVETILTSPAGDSATAQLILDTGNGRLDAVISRGFAERHPEVVRGMEGEDGVLGRGVGASLQGTIGRLSRVSVGDIVADQPRVGIAHEAVGAMAFFDGSLGVSVFRRFTLVVDYPKSRVILIPSTLD